MESGVVRRSVTRFVKESRLLRYVRLYQPEIRLWGREAGTLPSFLVIGAQRSGSTFLHDYLSLNTSARSSPLQKEIHYFNNKFYKPLQWYAKFFEPLNGVGPDVKNFETSPGYLYHPTVPKRVRECLPEVKAVAVLRNPVERAISQYKWIRKCDLETRGPVEAFRADAEQVEREQDESYLTQFEDPLHFDFEHFHHGYLRRSLYHVQLRRWLRHFPAAQLRVLSSTALFERTQDVIDELAAFFKIERVGEAQMASINQNSSPDGIEVPAEARDIAEQHLADVESKVWSVITPDMVVGDTFTLE
jgi:hypothetical protein